MDPSLVLGIAAALVAGIGANLLSGLLDSYAKLQGKNDIEIKVDGEQIKVSSLSREEMEKLLDEILDKQRSRVFVSYSSVDKRFAKKLTEGLREHNIEVWLAEEQINVGDSIANRLREGVLQSRWIVFVLSQETLESPWVNSELEFALEREKELGYPFILPAVLDDSVELPQVISGRAYADFRTRYDQGFNALLKTIKPGDDSEPSHPSFSEIEQGVP